MSRHNVQHVPNRQHPIVTSEYEREGVARDRVIGNRWSFLLIAVLLSACGGGGGDDPPPPAEPITVQAGNDRIVRSGDTVTINGFAHPGNFTYSWSQTGGSPQVVLTGDSTANPTFTAPTVTENVKLIFQLTATSADGQSASSTVSITVDAPPTADAGDDQIVVSCGRVALDGTFSSDFGYGRVGYSWSQTGGSPQVVLTDGDTARATFDAYTVPGGTTLDFELKVTDASGQTDVSVVSVTVNTPEASPTGSHNAVISATSTSGDAPFKLSLDGWGSASGDGSCIASYEWYLNAIGHLYGPGPHNVVLPPGNHGIELCVLDVSGTLSNCAEETVTVSAGDGSEYGLRVRDDRIIIFDITELEDFFDLGAENSSIRDQFAQHVSWVVQTYFQDDFDFLMLMFNRALENRYRLGSNGILGEYHGVQNSVSGLGYYGLFDFTPLYGSEGRLQGIGLIGGRYGFESGTVLHEIMHRWGNKGIIPTDDRGSWGAHWGFSNVYGQLGGFDERYLQRVPQHDNRHGEAYEITQGGFSPNNAREFRGEDRYVKIFSPLELYLMGLIPLDEVPVIRAATDTEPVAEFSGSRRHVHTVAQWEVYNHARILNEGGPREPPYGQAQTEFKTAVVFFVSDEYPPVEQELEQLSQQVHRFGRHSDANSGDETSFWEATGGRATMEMDRLSLSRRAVPTPPNRPPPSAITSDRLRSGWGSVPSPPIHCDHGAQ